MVKCHFVQSMLICETAYNTAGYNTSNIQRNYLAIDLNWWWLVVPGWYVLLWRSTMCIPL